jgi:hypothetical protein
MEKGSGLLATYPEAMRIFQNTYLSERDIDDKTAVVFFFNQYGASGEKDRNADGFMPRDKQFGYMFTQGFTTDNELYIGTAHELGHGMFSLKHPFDNDYKMPALSTDNLMDYNDETHIAKWQWDLIHDPGVILRVFERDEDAMDISQDTDYEWILEIYSPMISEKLIKAKDDNDYYEMRRLTYYALQNTFSNDWNEKVTFGFELPKENPVAKLKRNTNAKYGGVRVYYTVNKEIDGKYVGIMSRTTPLYFPPQQTGPYDKYFPVDVKLYEGENKSTGDTYYGENDFIASFDEASFIVGVGKGSGIMYGHLRGFGYCEFYYTYKGVGVDITFYTHGVIQGKKSRDRELYGPELITGKGEQQNIGAGHTGTSQWRSMNNGEISFSGTSSYFSIGIGKGSAAKIVTCTKLLFPLKLMEEDMEKNFINCCCELKLKNCCKKNE